MVWIPVSPFRKLYTTALVTLSIDLAFFSKGWSMLSGMGGRTVKVSTTMINRSPVVILAVMIYLHVVTESQTSVNIRAAIDWLKVP